MLNIALVGAGGMGKRHASCYQQIPNTRLVAIVDPDIKAAQSIVRDDTGVFSTLEEVLRMYEVDIVDICAPTPFHRDYAVQALQAGKHLLLEKPMALTLEECNQIIAAAQKAGSVAMVAHVLRFFPEFSHAKKAIDSGAVGRPAVVRTSRGGSFPRGGDSWYADISKSGGVALDLIIHDFDWLRWCFGPAERVYAKGLAHSGRPAADYALVTIRFKSGVIAHVEGTWMRSSGFEVKFEVAGDGGLLDYRSRDAIPLRIALRDGQEGLAAVEVPESPLAESPYQLQLCHFIDCVEGRSQPIVTLHDARAAVEISVAALESMKTGQPVSLKYQEN